MRYTVGRYNSLPKYDWGGALTGASSGFKMGASIGSLFGPLGTVIGGGLAAGIGAIFGNRAENRRIAAQRAADAAVAEQKRKAKLEQDALYAQQTRNTDLNELDNLELTNTNSLFLSKGGWIQKANASIKRRGTEGVCSGSNYGSSSCPPGSKRYNLAKTFRAMARNRAEGGPVDGKSPWYEGYANKQIKTYRNNAASLDSLSKNYLVPALLKKYNLTSPDQIGEDHSLTQEEINNAIPNGGSKLYKENLDYFSKYLNYKKYKGLEQNVIDTQGTNESADSTMSNYRFGKRLYNFTNNIPNITIPITETKNGKTSTIKEYRIYEPTDNIPNYMQKSNGGKATAKGRLLSNGNKLLTNNQNTTSGYHETGDNLPVVRNGNVVAYAEPGEVLVNDKDMPYTPFILSKRSGFAQQFMQLEGMKNRYNKDIIESRQADLIRSNNRLVKKSGNIPIAEGGYRLGINNVNRFLDNTTNNVGLRPNKVSFNPTTDNSSAFLNFLKSDKFQNGANTVMDIAGTIGNLAMSNKVLKRQQNLINSSLKESLNYNPRYARNYMLNDNVNVSDQVSAANTGYVTSTSNLDGIDPAIASAIKATGYSRLMSNLNNIYGNRDRQKMAIDNQNTMNIMNVNTANTELANQTSLMKLNAVINANEQLGNLESARLNNFQGAISEFNAVRNDRLALHSMNNRWKDTIGTDYMKCGGRLKRKKRA